MKCSRCGSMIPDGAYFCDCCGKEIELEARYSGALAAADAGRAPGAGAAAGAAAWHPPEREHMAGPAYRFFEKIGAVLMGMTLTQALLLSLLIVFTEYGVSSRILSRVWIYPDHSVMGIINLIICRFLPLKQQVPFYFTAAAYVRASGLDLILWILMDLCKILSAVLVPAAAWRMFKKAGQRGRDAVIPLCNGFVTSKIATGWGGWFILLAAAAGGMIWGFGFEEDFSDAAGWCVIGVLVLYVFIFWNLAGSFGLGKWAAAAFIFIPMFYALLEMDSTGFASLAVFFFPEPLIFLLGFGSAAYTGPLKDRKKNRKKKGNKGLR